MGKTRMNRKIFWSDLLFINEVREIKRMKSLNDKREYSDGDITGLIARDPLFQEIKSKLVNSGKITAQIKIQMDRKRGGLR